MLAQSLPVCCISSILSATANLSILPNVKRNTFANLVHAPILNGMLVQAFLPFALSPSSLPLLVFRKGWRLDTITILFVLVSTHHVLSGVRVLFCMQMHLER